VQKNDSRKLENTLVRLWKYNKSDYTWRAPSEDFLILALDSSNTEWLE
jgi:tRNA A37 N6-isopentenylltransferase MiaA